MRLFRKYLVADPEGFQACPDAPEELSDATFRKSRRPVAALYLPGPARARLVAPSVSVSCRCRHAHMHRARPLKHLRAVSLSAIVLPATCMSGPPSLSSAPSFGAASSPLESSSSSGSVQAFELRTSSCCCSSSRTLYSVQIRSATS